jgi:hypothetical protein
MLAAAPAHADIMPAMPNALPRSPFLPADLTPIIEMIRPDKKQRMPLIAQKAKVIVAAFSPEKTDVIVQPANEKKIDDKETMKPARHNLLNLGCVALTF